jgi:sulfur carrier protein
MFPGKSGPKFDYNGCKIRVSTNVPIRILVNGEPQVTNAGQTVLGLLSELHLDPARVAVELDRRIVKQPAWGDTPLSDGAQVEIVQFVGGG